MGKPFLGSIDGPVILNEIAGQNTYLAIKAANGYNAELNFHNNAIFRNSLYLDSTGSNLIIESRNTSGAIIDNPITIANSAGGNITFSRNIKTTTILGGTSTDFTYYTATKALITNGIVNASADGSAYGLVAESNTGTINTIGLLGVAKTVANNASYSATGVSGLAYAGVSTHPDDVVGVRGSAYGTHSGGKNVAFYASASSATAPNNYSFYGSSGRIYNADTTASTSISTGSVVFSGGLGVALDTFIGGKLNLTAKAATTVNGDIWQDSTQNSISTYISGAQQQISGVIWTKTSTTTLSNWTTATTILGAVGTGVGTLTIPANLLKVGKTIRLRLKGLMTTATNGYTYNFNVTLGGTSLRSTGALTPAASLSNREWVLDLDITCITTGSSGTVMSSGIIHISNSGTSAYIWPLASTTTTTINTTTALAINVTVACNTASSSYSISCQNATVEILN